MPGQHSRGRSQMTRHGTSGTTVPRHPTLSASMSTFPLITQPVASGFDMKRTRRNGGPADVEECSHVAGETNRMLCKDG